MNLINVQNTDAPFQKHLFVRQIAIILNKAFLHFEFEDFNKQ